MAKAKTTRNTGTPQRARAKATPKRKRKPKAKVEAKPWPEVFLSAFAEVGNVAAACRAAGIGRTTAYRHRQQDEAFALAWYDIEEETTERMEAEAYRRGVEGVLKPVFQRGEEVGTIREYSDRLLIFMLTARRPEKYRERIDHRHSGGIEQPPAVDLSKLSLEESRTLQGLLAKAKRDAVASDRSRV